MLQPDAPTESEVPSLRSLMWRLGVGLFALMVAIGLLGLFLREPLEDVSAWFIGEFGRTGLFFGVLVMDAVPLTTHEPLLFLGYAGGIAFWEVVAIAGTASFLSASVGWSLGRVLSRWQLLPALLERYRVGPFLRRYGAAAVAVAAITPFPYAVVTWGAGACGVPLPQVMLGASLRYVKVLFYAAVIVFGWNATL